MTSVINEMFVDEAVNIQGRYNEFREQLMVEDIRHYIKYGEEAVNEGFIGSFFSKLKELIQRAWNAIKSIFSKSEKIIEEKVKENKKIVEEIKEKEKDSFVELELYPVIQSVISKNIISPLESIEVNGDSAKFDQNFENKITRGVLRNIGKEIVKEAEDITIRDKVVKDKKSIFNDISIYEILKKHNFIDDDNIDDIESLIYHLKLKLGIFKKFKYKVDLSKFEPSIATNADEKGIKNRFTTIEKINDSFFKELLTQLKGFESKIKAKHKKEYLSKMSGHINSLISINGTITRQALLSIDREVACNTQILKAMKSNSANAA